MKESKDERRIRQSKELINQALDTLDSSTSETTFAPQRSAERFQYRVVSARCEVPDGSSGFQSYMIATRNISRNGVSFVCGQFLYPSTRCRVVLTTLHNLRHEVEGRIVRCRYLAGTGALHEIGFQFDKAIDVALFVRGAMHTKVLLIDDDEEFHELVKNLLKNASISIESVLSGKDACERIEQGEAYDMALLDIMMPELDGFECFEALRKLGFLHPIIAVSSDERDERVQRAFEMGFSEYLIKPVSRDSLLAMISSMKDEPIISSLIHEKEMAGLIDTFVEKLPAKVREMERLYAEGALDQLKEQTQGLKGKAGTFGFEVLTDKARELEAAISKDAPLQDIRKELNQLCRLCLAARPANADSEEPESAEPKDVVQ